MPWIARTRSFRHGTSRVGEPLCADCAQSARGHGGGQRWADRPDQQYLDLPKPAGFPTYEAEYPQYNIGYQYFGGITNWLNDKYDGPSRSPVKTSTSKPTWVLAADATMKVNGKWGGVDRDVAYGNMPQHRKVGSKVPQGGNQLFIDGSALWIKAETMYFLHSWGAGSSRAGYFYQDDSDFPANLRAQLTFLKFTP